VSSQLEPNHDERNMARWRQAWAGSRIADLAEMATAFGVCRAHAAQSMAFDGLTIAALVSWPAWPSAQPHRECGARHSGDNNCCICWCSRCARRGWPGRLLDVMMLRWFFGFARHGANEGKPYQYPLLKRLGDFENLQVFDLTHARLW